MSPEERTHPSFTTTAVKDLGPVNSLPAEAGLWASRAAAPTGQAQPRLEPEQRPAQAEVEVSP